MSPQPESGEPAAQAAAAQRVLLLERATAGMVHEAKNPLHTMLLHLQLLREKLGAQASALDRHATALRDGIGKVDEILRAFADWASPAARADLGHAVSRAFLLFAFDARRASVDVRREGPEDLPVSAPGPVVRDLTAHLFLAGLALGREGGSLLATVRSGGSGTLRIDVSGGVPKRDEARLHLDAAELLSRAAGGELRVNAPEGTPAAQLHLSLPLVR